MNYNMYKKITFVLILFSFFILNLSVNAANDSIVRINGECKKIKDDSKNDNSYYAINSTQTDSCSKYSSNIAECVSHFVVNANKEYEPCNYLIVQQDKNNNSNLDSMSKEFCTSSVDDSCFSHDTNGVNCSNTTNSEKTNNCVSASAYNFSNGSSPLLYVCASGGVNEKKDNVYVYIKDAFVPKIKKEYGAINSLSDFSFYLRKNITSNISSSICVSNGNQYTEEEKAEIEKKNPDAFKYDSGKVDKDRNEVYNPEDEEKDLGLEEWNQKKCSELSDSDCKKRQDCQMVGGTCSDAEIAKDPCNEKSIRQVLKFFGYLLMIAKVVVPFILIGFAVYDLYKSIIDKDEKALKTKLRMIMFRIIAGVTVFFIPDLVWVGFKYIEKSNITGDQYQVCAECVLKPSSNELCTVEDNSTNE